MNVNMETSPETLLSKLAPFNWSWNLTKDSINVKSFPCPIRTEEHFKLFQRKQGKHFRHYASQEGIQVFGSGQISIQFPCFSLPLSDARVSSAGLGSLGSRCCNLVSFVHENEFVLLFALICLINYVYASDYYVFSVRAPRLRCFSSQVFGFPNSIPIARQLASSRSSPTPRG